MTTFRCQAPNIPANETILFNRVILYLDWFGNFYKYIMYVPTSFLFFVCLTQRTYIVNYTMEKYTALLQEECSIWLKPKGVK